MSRKDKGQRKTAMAGVLAAKPRVLQESKSNGIKKVVENCTCEMGKGVPHVHMEVEPGIEVARAHQSQGDAPKYPDGIRHMPNAKINNKTQSNYHGGYTE